MGRSRRKVVEEEPSSAEEEAESEDDDEVKNDLKNVPSSEKKYSAPSSVKKVFITHKSKYNLFYCYNNYNLPYTLTYNKMTCYFMLLCI